MTVSSILHHVSNLVRHHWLIYNQTRWHWFIYNYDYGICDFKTNSQWDPLLLKSTYPISWELIGSYKCQRDVTLPSRWINIDCAQHQNHLLRTRWIWCPGQNWGLIRPISDPVLAAFALITDKLRSRWIRSRLSRRHRLLLSLTHHSGRASPKWHSRPMLYFKLCVSFFDCLQNYDKFYANKLIYIYI